ncbi:hypothetical protein HUT13_02000 [Streptomyces harbinensis]|uniref:hypothetical protein n=1 Tax=Streptomyces harbinensis TaxID=1176198 RepID=UPI0015927E8D|nr:hypothetical protein [Streptomyces harbinensis]QKV67680.1 hypothetical protein HUT13_02000 [Streptomyces harbinensis]
MTLTHRTRIGRHRRTIVFGLLAAIIAGIVSVLILARWTMERTELNGLGARDRGCGMGEWVTGVSQTDVAGQYIGDMYGRVILEEDGAAHISDFPVLSWEIDREFDMVTTSGTWRLIVRNGDRQLVDLTFDMPNELGGERTGEVLEIGSHANGFQLSQYIGDPDSCHLNIFNEG